jgi:hypothetical protein
MWSSLAKLFGRKQPTNPRKTLRPTYRPMVEALEDRALPSIGVLSISGGLELVDMNNPLAYPPRNTITLTGLTFASGGLVHFDTITAVAFRPATGQLYGLANDDYDFSVRRLYTINLFSGVATQVGGNIPVNYIYGTDGSVDMSFDPVADLIRVVQLGSGENFRLDPNTGAIVGVDTPYEADDSTIMGPIAYDRQVQGATGTTLFGIQQFGPQNGHTNAMLVRIGGVDGDPSPNGAQLTNIGPLGYPVNRGYLAIASDGTAYAEIDTSTTQFGTVNLATGQFTPIAVSASLQQSAGFAIAPDNAIIPPPAPPPPPPPPSPSWLANGFFAPDVPPQIRNFEYRRVTVGGFEATIAQAQGVSLTNALVSANVDASDSQTQAVGLFARSQSNGDMYVGVLTHDGTAQIWLFHGNTNSYTVLKSVDVGTNTGYFQFEVVNSTSLSLFLNSNFIPVATVTDSSITSAGGVGAITVGDNGRFDNFTW